MEEQRLFSQISLFRMFIPIDCFLIVQKARKKLIADAHVRQNVQPQIRHCGVSDKSLDFLFLGDLYKEFSQVTSQLAHNYYQSSSEQLYIKQGKAIFGYPNRLTMLYLHLKFWCSQYMVHTIIRKHSYNSFST